MTVKRVVYEKNPITEVILQIRYPSILAINANDPVEFQEKIRDEFPIYRTSVTQQREITLSFGENSSLASPSVKQSQKLITHSFISKDGYYKINLTQDFISISTVHYTKWEDFINRFNNVLKCFNAIYLPTFYSRVGLRYTDVFSREKLGLTGAPWKELVSSEYLGAFSVADESKVINNTTDSTFILDDAVSQMRVRTGLLKQIPGSVVNYVVDSDFSKSGYINLEEFDSLISYLHNEAGKFISSAISEKLKKAMNPTEIGEYD